MIAAGQQLPDAALYEFIHEEGEGCSLGPNAFKTLESAKGKTLVVFALPGAYTPTCSAKHLPGFIEKFDELKARGVDEIWCVSVNDAFVMDAWGRTVGAQGKVRMMADGSAEFTRKAGMELDLTARGMGVRSQRYSMIVKDGVVSQVNLDPAGQFENSTVERILEQL